MKPLCNKLKRYPKAMYIGDMRIRGARQHIMDRVERKLFVEVPDIFHFIQMEYLREGRL